VSKRPEDLIHPVSNSPITNFYLQLLIADIAPISDRSASAGSLEPLRVERMNVLVPSRGNSETFAQKSSQTPFCRSSSIGS